MAKPNVTKYFHMPDKRGFFKKRLTLQYLHWESTCIWFMVIIKGGQKHIRQTRTVWHSIALSYAIEGTRWRCVSDDTVFPFTGKAPCAAGKLAVDGTLDQGHCCGFAYWGGHLTSLWPESHPSTSVRLSFMTHRTGKTPPASRQC